MAIEETTAPDSLSARLIDVAGRVRDRFSAEFRAGRDPRIEDYLEGHEGPAREAILRALIASERDCRAERGDPRDSRVFRARFPEHSALIDELFGPDGPTVTLPRRDRDDTDAGLLFGLLGLANGLIAPDALPPALDDWASGPARSLRRVLVEREGLDEAAAGLVEALAGRHLAGHGGIPWRSLMALATSTRLDLDWKRVADPEIRAILAGLVGDPADPDAPTRVGDSGHPSHRYEVIRRHARGGLGVVSLARDAELHREVALKEIRPDCADNPEYRARFLREAEVTGRLEHPGIVPVYGLGHHPDGRPYYSMRFIRGETLKDAIARLYKPAKADEGTRPDERCDLHALLGRFVNACHALAYAHHRKVLHRDVKPANIMLGPYGETLVVDWGLAKTFDGPSSAESPVNEETLRPESDSGLTPTRLGSDLGTIGYMSPEQAAGRLGELGPPSDIYSLGVTLYCLITGHAPFEGAGKEEFLRRVLDGDFPRPRQVNPATPRALEAVCLKALALRPVDRYPTAEALADDLERWRAGQPVGAYPEPALDRLARWSRSHRTALAGLAVLLVSATIGLAVLAAQERRGARLIADERDAAQGDLKLTRGSLRLLLEGLSGPDLAYLANSGPPRLKLANQVLGFYRDLGEKHPDDPGVKFELANACRVAANIGRLMGQLEPARGLYGESIGLLRPLVADDPGSDDYRLGLALGRVELGEHFRMAGRPRAAEAEQINALEALKRPEGAGPGDDRYPRTEAIALINLAASRVETGRFLEAQPQARRAVDLLVPLVEKPRAAWNDRLFLVYALDVRASGLKGAGDREGAVKDLVEAARHARELSKTWSNTDTRFALAMILDEQGRMQLDSAGHAEALKSSDEAHEILTGLWRNNQRFVFLERELAVAWNGRAEARIGLLGAKPDPKAVQLAIGDCAKANEYLERLVKTWPAHYDYHSQLGRTRANYAHLELALGRPDSARGWLEKSLASHRAALKENPESPEDKKLEKAIAEEFKAIDEGPKGAQTTP